MVHSRRWTWFVIWMVAGLIVAGCGSASDVTPTSPAATPTSLLPPATQPSGDAAGHLTAAQTALENGNLVLAEQEYRNAAALDPESARAQFGLGNVYVRLNHLSEAEAAFKAALALEPNMTSAHVNLGVTYYQMGQLSKAADELNAALRLEPDDAQTLYLLGAVRLQENNLSAAEELLLKARDLKPDLPEVYYGLGVLYKLKGQKTEAITAFEKFLEVGPGQDPAAMDHARQELKSLQGQ